MNAIPVCDFTESTKVNGTRYLYLEQAKSYSLEKDGQKHSFTLRRFYLLNTATKRRASALAYGAKVELSQEDCIYAILNRWGASENTFKHKGSRQPDRYRPGFAFHKSDNQTIANPEIKEYEKKIKAKQREYNNKCKELSQTEPVQNKSGARRANSAYGRLKAEVQKLKAECDELSRQKSLLPERIDVSELEDYRNFEKQDNQGKNLFDFTGAMVWNARKKGVELLKTLYPFKNDVVDLFYAIINCHGNVQITHTEIRVVLEPLQQSSRRAAQIDFCKKLTQMGAKTPLKKKMIIQVKATK